MYLPNILYTISKALHNKNARAIVVGGSVRDHFLALESKDYDIEVFGLKRVEDLIAILETYGEVNLVGRSFGVLKFTYEKEEFDFSFPRSERKIGEKHQDFEITIDSTMTFEQAAKRRDFTINALGFDIEDSTFLDPYGGLKDIKAKRLQHIDDNTFIEDPLRLYRAVQFCARFGYSLADNTFKLCQQMVTDGLLEALPKERIYMEWEKLLLKAPVPSQGFELMRELGILRYFPELEALIGVKQSVKWHPEGDVWVHTMMALDKMAILCHNTHYTKHEQLTFLFAILCHDLGKATKTTIDAEGKIQAIGHEYAGVEPTRSLMYRLTNAHDFIESLLPLVEHHLKPSQFYHAKSKKSAIRKLATKVNIEQLVLVAKADFLGRTTEASLAGIYHAGEWLLEQAKSLKVDREPLKTLLQGRDLITLGFTPSVQFREILDDVYNLQLEGQLSTVEDALAYVKGKYL